MIQEIKTRGFTLVELLVVVVILGILGAIMLPQYQRAVLKSRYASLMPIAKAMAESNEVYYLEHGVYADNTQDLPMQGRMNYPDGTELEFGTSSDYSYVLATRNNNFPNNYIVYQKHSGQFPGEIHCEADTNNTQAQDVCKSFGPTEDIGETLTSGYLTYVLFGTGNGEAPSEDEGENEPEEPQTPPVTNMTAEEAQAFADLNCRNTSYGCEGIANEDGTITVCEKKYATVTEAGTCVPNGSTDIFETVYTADGIKKQGFRCTSSDEPYCNGGILFTYNPDGSYTAKQRICANSAEFSHDGTCPNGVYEQFGYDTTKNSQGDQTSEFTCSAVNDEGQCSAYSRMYTYDDSYSGNSMRGRVTNKCVAISQTDPATCTDNNFKPQTAWAYSASGSSGGINYLKCYNSSGGVSYDIAADGSCATSGYNWKQYNDKTGQYTLCGDYSKINWEMATCN